MNSDRVLGSGLIAVDHIFLTEKKGGDGEFLGSSGGGSVSNALSMLSLLGYNCSIFGLMGGDASRYIAEKEFREYGVNQNYVSLRTNERDIIKTRQYSHIIYKNGKHEYKEMCLNCGSSFGRQYQISKSDIKRGLTELSLKSKILVVDRANAPTIQLARNVKSKNGFVAYDLNFVSHGKYAERVNDLLGLCDLVKTDKRTMKELLRHSEADEVSSWKHEFPNIKYLLITDSSNGVDCYFNLGIEEKYVHRNAIENENVRDTGGAGDVFLAVSIHELTNKGEVIDENDFAERIDRAQALASLSCSLFGSRALQRFLLNNRQSPEEIMKNADEIRSSGKVRITLDPSIGLSKFDFRPFLLSKKGICPICGSDQNQKRKSKLLKDNQKISFEQMAKTLNGITNAMFAGFDTSLSYRDSLAQILTKSAIFVGSGGSFSSSTFGEYLSLKNGGKLAKAITPFELEGWNRIPENVIIFLISHGGLNTDILGAALHIEKLGWKDVIVVTGNKNSTLSELATRNGWKLVLITSMERNFVSTIGLLSQVSALAALLVTSKELNNLKEYFEYASLGKKLKEYLAEAQALVDPVSQYFSSSVEPHIIAFGRGWGWPALVDLESKVIEGGICTIEISELKNYTHGRWMNLYGKESRILMIFETPEDIELVQFLNKKFKNFPTMNIKTEYSGVAGSIDLLLKTLLVANFIGKHARKNILKPKFPPQGRGLYSWEPEYRRGVWKRENAEDKGKTERGNIQRNIDN